MTDNVLEFDGVTRCDLNAHDVLKALSDEQDIEHVLCICYRKGGVLTYHSSNGNAAEVNLWVDMFKQDVIIDQNGRADD